jgi:hypothetical protein
MLLMKKITKFSWDVFFETFSSIRQFFFPDVFFTLKTALGSHSICLRRIFHLHFILHNKLWFQIDHTNFKKTSKLMNTTFRNKIPMKNEIRIYLIILKFISNNRKASYHMLTSSLIHFNALMFPRYNIESHPNILLLLNTHYVFFSSYEIEKVFWLK